jgi:GAF domain-containing protein
MLLSPTTQHLQGRLERVFGFDWHNGTILPNTTVSTAQRRALNNAMPETFQEQGEHGLTVPIMLRGSVLGVIEFRAARATGWNSRQIELARVIAQRLALALDNLRLFEQAQIAAQREQIASQLSARLQSRTEVDAVLALATEAFQEALGATRASIRFGVPEPTPPEVLSASAADADYGPNGNALRPEHGPERGPERGPQSQPQQESVQP